MRIAIACLTEGYVQRFYCILFTARIGHSFVGWLPKLALHKTCYIGYSRYATASNTVKESD